jgi:hypothetical protein
MEKQTRNINVSAHFHHAIEDIAVIEVEGLEKPVSFSFNLEWIFEMVAPQFRDFSFKDIVKRITKNTCVVTDAEWEKVDFSTALYICQELWNMFKENNPEIKFPRKNSDQAHHLRKSS